MGPHSRGPAALHEPVLLQALAKRHPGPVEYDPKVGRGDAEFLTNLLSLQLLHHVLGEIAITKLQDRDTQQISAVGMDEGGEFGVGHTDIAQKRRPMIDAIGVTGHTRAERSFAARRLALDLNRTRI